MLVYQSHRLVYIMLYPLPAADNDFSLSLSFTVRERKVAGISTTEFDGIYFCTKSSYTFIIMHMDPFNSECMVLYRRQQVPAPKRLQSKIQQQGKAQRKKKELEEEGRACTYFNYMYLGLHP